MKKHKNIVVFLIKFFATYFILVTIYNFYLQNSQQKEGGFKTASITTLVAHQTESLLEFFGYHVDALQHKKELSVKLLIENQYTARVIEGCNSISVIILFIAFIVAFSGSIKATVLFSLFGALFIYTINVVRIAFLTVLIYKYPERQEFLHNLVFPAIIYGCVFLLWVIWVNKFSNYKK
ncbi:exosortase family protein XrtF [Polaribacter aquimarinus]|uniref:Exosortase family protein XrtF n=1 Tax=Polaribacter aquimarinus TaxID=2100726 RepID=A0A2U2J8L2_9FLAO|nr:exosortase family protein XrtF [Polaribacter aquimarinus]PWG04642.1 exosortase family protein XrtF [Polaribacter aquimarinus]